MTISFLKKIDGKKYLKKSFLSLRIDILQEFYSINYSMYIFKRIVYSMDNIILKLYHTGLKLKRLENMFVKHLEYFQRYL